MNRMTELVSVVRCSSVLENDWEDEDEVDESASEEPGQDVAVLKNNAETRRVSLIGRRCLVEQGQRTAHLSRSEMEVVLHVHDKSEGGVSLRKKDKGGRVQLEE